MNIAAKIELTYVNGSTVYLAYSSMATAQQQFDEYEAADGSEEHVRCRFNSIGVKLRVDPASIFAAALIDVATERAVLEQLDDIYSDEPSTVH